MSVDAEIVAVLASAAGYNLRDLKDGTLDDRIRFQKVVYFIQQRPIEIDLGYQFGLYVYGPYSPALAECGREIAANLDTCMAARERYQIRDNYSHKLNDLGEMATEGAALMATEKGERPRQTRFLELASTLHFLRSCCNGDEAAALQRCREKKPWASEEQVQKTQAILRSHGFW